MSQGAADKRVEWCRNWTFPNVTTLLATSLNLQGSRLVLWLMARLLMCLGSAPKTWQLPVVLVTAFNMAFTSATLAFAKPPAEKKMMQARKVRTTLNNLLLLADL